jgi:hypothetical protein
MAQLSAQGVGFDTSGRGRRLLRCHLPVEGVVGEVAALGGGGCADDVHDLGRQVAVCVVGVRGVVLVRCGLVGEAVLPLVHVLEDAPSGELVAVHLVGEHRVAVAVDRVLLPVAGQSELRPLLPPDEVRDRARGEIATLRGGDAVEEGEVVEEERTIRPSLIESFQTTLPGLDDPD